MQGASLEENAAGAVPEAIVAAEEDELRELRAVLFANVAACLIKLVRLTVGRLSNLANQVLWARRNAGRTPSRLATMVRCLSATLRSPARQLPPKANARHRSAGGQSDLHQGAIPPSHRFRSARELVEPLVRTCRCALAAYSTRSWPADASRFAKDYNTLESLPGITQLVAKSVALAKTRLPPLIAVQQDKEKDEVLGKLKDLGNTVLGALSRISFLLAHLADHSLRWPRQVWPEHGQLQIHAAARRRVLDEL